jgi:ferredoxin-type protein NapF
MELLTMGNAINRAQFLRGDFAGRQRPLRPPWALTESAFIESCTRCGDCIAVCPQHILEPGRGGFPQVNFSHGECLFCADCVRACRPGALAAATVAWSIRARIGDACLTRRGVECRSCADQCESIAIRFRPTVGCVAQPALDAGSCNGCGACYRVCPAQAITLGEFDQYRTVLYFLPRDGEQRVPGIQGHGSLQQPHLSTGDMS